MVTVGGGGSEMLGPTLMVPVRVSFLIPFLFPHDEARLPGTGRSSDSVPPNEPVALPAFTLLGVKLALPAYLVPATVPLNLPFHVIVSMAATPVEPKVTQFSGLFANEPMALVLLMVTAPLLGLHLESLASTADELVPPPDFVSGGENDTLAETEHATEPGAAPENFGSFSVLAATGDDISAVARTPASMTVTTDRRTVDDPFRHNLSGFFTAERPPFRIRRLSATSDRCWRESRSVIFNVNRVGPKARPRAK